MKRIVPMGVPASPRGHVTAEGSAIVPLELPPQPQMQRRIRPLDILTEGHEVAGTIAALITHLVFRELADIWP